MGLYFGVSYYRRPTIGPSPTTFHTVSEGEFCEFRELSVLGSSAILAAFATMGATAPVGAWGKELLIHGS
jgi:hypothetical protein